MRLIVLARAEPIPQAFGLYRRTEIVRVNLMDPRETASVVFRKVGRRPGDKTPHMRHVALLGRAAVNCLSPGAEFFRRIELFSACGVVFAARESGETSTLQTFIPLRQFLDNVVVWTFPDPWSSLRKTSDMTSFLNHYERDSLRTH